MTHYYGLTLGPIYDTLSKVRATRELWGASYLFSDLMRRILEAIAKTDGIKILLPAMDEQDARKKTGVGIYPDRMIAQGSNADGEKIQQAIQADAPGSAPKASGSARGSDNRKAVGVNFATHHVLCIAEAHTTRECFGLIISCLICSIHGKASVRMSEPLSRCVAQSHPDQAPDQVVSSQLEALLHAHQTGKLHLGFTRLHSRAC